MHSVAVDRSGSPKKRTLSRGVSEDESLRIIIQEADSPSRRLTRTDSRGGNSLKRKTDNQQSDQDMFKALPDVMELQTSYEEVVQELHGLEVEREVLLFQVDVLQDTLESVEELLAEAQREAKQASMKVEQERMAKRELEDTVRALMSEVERLKEERNTISSPPARSLLIQAEAAASVHSPPPSGTRAWDCADGASASTPPPPGATERGAPVVVVAASNGFPVVAKESPLQKMVDITQAQMTTLALDDPCPPEGVLGRPCGRQAQVQADAEDTDSVSAYEDASADTPELDHAFPGVEDDEEEEEEEDDDLRAPGEKGQGRDPNNPDPNTSCIVS